MLQRPLQQSASLVHGGVLKRSQLEQCPPTQKLEPLPQQSDLLPQVSPTSEQTCLQLSVPSDDGAVLARHVQSLEYAPLGQQYSPG